MKTALFFTLFPLAASPIHVRFLAVYPAREIVKHYSSVGNNPLDCREPTGRYGIQGLNDDGTMVLALEEGDILQAVTDRLDPLQGDVVVMWESQENGQIQLNFSVFAAMGIAFTETRDPQSSNSRPKFDEYACRR